MAEGINTFVVVTHRKDNFRNRILAADKNCSSQMSLIYSLTGSNNAVMSLMAPDIKNFSHTSRKLKEILYLIYKPNTNYLSKSESRGTGLKREM